MATITVNLTNVQETLVSGTNIKTVNGTSLLGSGNIVAGSEDLAGTLALGNTTGGTDVSISSGDLIKAQGGGSTLILDSSSNIGISTDSGAFVTSGIYLSALTATFSGGTGSASLLADKDIFITSSSSKVDITASTSLLLEEAGNAFTMPSSAGQLALVNQITPLATDNQSITDLSRVITLNTSDATSSLTFENASNTPLLTVQGNGVVYANGAGGVVTNTAFGAFALDSGAGSGSDNSAFGHSALSDSLLSGSDNSAFGVSAGLNITTGSNNVLLGALSGQNLSTSNGNVVIGRASASVLTSGSANVIMGTDSGRWITGGVTTLTDISTSVLIGNAVKAGGNSEINQIVIGHNSTGNGSNTTTIGNSSIVGTFLQGAVIVGEYTVATLPTASTYQAGIIMVSDETGGYTQAFSDGTNWRRVQDRAVVS